jgi:hypothetical protein
MYQQSLVKISNTIFQAHVPSGSCPNTYADRQDDRRDGATNGFSHANPPTKTSVLGLTSCCNICSYMAAGVGGT